MKDLTADLSHGAGGQHAHTLHDPAALPSCTLKWMVLVSLVLQKSLQKVFTPCAWNKELVLDFTCEVWGLKWEAHRCAWRTSQLYWTLNPDRGREVQLKKRAASLTFTLTRSSLVRRLLWITLIKWAVTQRQINTCYTLRQGGWWCYDRDKHISVSRPLSTGAKSSYKTRWVTCR